MDNDEQHLINLVKQFAEGSISQADYVVLMEYLKAADQADPIFVAMDDVWKNMGVDEPYSAEEADAFYQHMINDKRFKANRTTYKLWPGVSKVRLRVAAAAAVLLVAGVALILYTTRNSESGRHSELNTEFSLGSGSPDIAPGKNTAVLTLANGKTISLSEAKTGVVVNATQLLYNDSTEARHPELVSGPRIVQTPRGGTYQITLPDGTKVWLNAASSLKFPSAFNELGKRKVELSGEAYFEVAKDKAHPFIVTTDKQSVEVLGTHFNISSYADEEATKTTLLEGSVRVSRQQKPGGVIGKGFSEVLKPNQQAVLTANKLDVITANIEQIVAWKNGQFAFQKQSLQEIMPGISRWYDVEVVFEPGFESIPFTGSVSRFKNISSVLHILELTGKVHFKIEGRRVTVMK